MANDKKKDSDYKIIEDKKTGDKYYVLPEDQIDFIEEIRTMINEYDLTMEEAILKRAKRLKEIQLKLRKKRPLKR